MPRITAYESGTPSWIDVSTTDLDGAAAFYGELFGWRCVEVGPPEDPSGYRMFQLGDVDVAGLGSTQGGPPMWNTYITSHDIAATEAAIVAAGGTVVAPTMQVMDAGKMLVAIDPTGAAFSVWQPIEHVGSGVQQDVGSACWSELNTRDPQAATTFYGSVFGWTAHGHAMTHDNPDDVYIELHVGDTPVAGLMDMRGTVPDEVPAHWLTYFAVADTDAVLARAVELGGSVMVPGTDIPPGRFGIAADPYGAFFAVLTDTASST